MRRRLYWSTFPFVDLEALVDSAIQMEGKLNQANENRKRRMLHQGRPNNVNKYRPSSSGGFSPRPNKPTVPRSRPNFPNRSGGHARPGCHNHNSHSNTFNRAPSKFPSNNNSNPAPRTGSNAHPFPPETSQMSPALNVESRDTTPMSAPRS
jgi:hypothetical protein